MLTSNKIIGGVVMLVGAGAIWYGYKRFKG